ncbi:MAG: VOC family protein [Minisyncoccia bacterium]
MKIHELGHVVLYVTSMERSVSFYRDVLGFNMIASGHGFSVFSSGRNHHEMLLIEVGGEVKEKRHLEPGLYHIGFKIGDGPEAARATYKELKEKNIPIVGTTDHGVTHSIYILDPDGNELELYADVSDSWKTDPTAIMAAAKRLILD